MKLPGAETHAAIETPEDAEEEPLDVLDEVDELDALDVLLELEPLELTDIDDELTVELLDRDELDTEFALLDAVDIELTDEELAALLDDMLDANELLLLIPVADELDDEPWGPPPQPASMAAMPAHTKMRHVNMDDFMAALLLNCAPIH